MLDLFNIAKPQGCDIQTFYTNGGGDGIASYLTRRSWNKPRGVSHIYMLLIGAGGNGDGTSGGGSGAVTTWYGAAQHVPDVLYVNIGTSIAGGTSVETKGTTLVKLLSASGASGVTGGTAMTANQFTASGFFQSVAGQDGYSGSSFASSTTFLAGGNPATGSKVSNYGYTRPSGANSSGFLLMQPIIVGMAGAGVGSGGIGCGGGSSSGAGTGGPGMVLIASW